MWWKEPSYLPHCGETFQSRKTCPSRRDAHLQINVWMRRLCTYNRRVCVHMCVCTCVCSLKCALHFSVNVQNFQKLEGKRTTFTLYDSADNTTCRLWAFPSVMSLSPQWCACVLAPQHSPSPACGPSATSAQCNLGEWGWLHPAH